ncbi:MAG: aminoacyl-tRNA hydrolase [Clostridia bacterium]|nr:aminoacyl-tRNA hydrolase [Clostridia bacterium]
MYLIVGLGNPDKKYLNTFHNMGFLCVDRLAKKLGGEFNKGECRAVTCHARVNGQKVIVAKPITYMNLSGESLRELVNKYKIEQGNLVVVYDDIDIPLGNLRLRKEGSAGTHNGMRSIVQHLGTTNFPRVRVGIGKQTPMALVDYVLSQVTEDDHSIVDKALDDGASALLDFVGGADFDKVMQKYNSKK